MQQLHCTRVLNRDAVHLVAVINIVQVFLDQLLEFLIESFLDLDRVSHLTQNLIQKRMARVFHGRREVRQDQEKTVAEKRGL